MELKIYATIDYKKNTTFKTIHIEYSGSSPLHLIIRQDKEFNKFIVNINNPHKKYTIHTELLMFSLKEFITDVIYPFFLQRKHYHLILHELINQMSTINGFDYKHFHLYFQLNYYFLEQYLYFHLEKEELIILTLNQTFELDNSNKNKLSVEVYNQHDRLYYFYFIMVKIDYGYLIKKQGLVLPYMIEKENNILLGDTNKSKRDLMIKHFYYHL